MKHGRVVESVVALLLIAIVFMPLNVMAGPSDPIGIKGYVTDSATGIGIVGATVTDLTDNTYHTTTTGGYYQYYVATPEWKQHTVQASMTGYTTQQQTISISRGTGWGVANFALVSTAQDTAGFSAGWFAYSGTISIWYQHWDSGTFTLDLYNPSNVKVNTWTFTTSNYPNRNTVTWPANAVGSWRLHTTSTYHGQTNTQVTVVGSDNAVFSCQRIDYSKKLDPEIPKLLQIVSWRNISGSNSMVINLLDPDNIVRATYYPTLNRGIATSYYFDLWNQYNASHTVSGKWTLSWTGYKYDGTATAGSDYLYVGFRIIGDRANQRTLVESANKMSVGELFPTTNDAWGVSTSSAVTLTNIENPSGSLYNLDVRVTGLYHDRFGNVLNIYRNEIRRINIIVYKQAIYDWGSTSTGTDGSYYNSAIDNNDANCQDCWNISLDQMGTPSLGPVGDSVLGEALSAIPYVGEVYWTYTFLDAVNKQFNGDPSNPRPAPLHDTSQLWAGSWFANGYLGPNAKLNASAYNYIRLTYDASKPITYAYKIQVTFSYIANGIGVTETWKDMPPQYICINST
jgi:hypothetical protein